MMEKHDDSAYPRVMLLGARLVASIAAACCVAGVAGATASACSEFSADEGDADDASVEAAFPRVEASADATGDSADAASVDAAFVCPAGAFLCDDFERSSLIGSWGSFVGDNNPAVTSSKLTLDTAFATSPTRSLRANPVAYTQAALTKGVVGVNRIEISFSLRAAAASTAQVQIVTVEFEPDVGYVQLALKDGQLAFIEQLRPPDAGPEYFMLENAAEAPIGKFRRYTFTVDRANKVATLVHGTSTATRQLVKGQAEMSRLSIGTVFTSADAPPHWFDDVVVLTSQ